MTQLSQADGILPYEVRIPVHPTACLCPQSPDCRGKAVGPQVPAHHPRRNLPAASMEALLDEVRRLVEQGPQGPASQERQAQIDQARANGRAPAMKWATYFE
jgi:hypothetical protein